MMSIMTATFARKNHILCYYTTNKEGYREYRSCGETCTKCRSLHKCTESKEHRKVVTRHVWEEYIEKAEDIRHTIGNKQIYELRKETIERLFGTAKRTAWIPIYPIQRERLPDGDESGAYVCVHESEETGKDIGTKRSKIHTHI